VTRRLLIALLAIIAAIWTVDGWAQNPHDATRDQTAAAKALIEAAIGAPFRVILGDQGTIRLSEALQFVPSEQAAGYLRANERPVPDRLLGMFMYGGRQEAWYATISFERDGFVDITQIRRWSPDDVLASLRSQLKIENEQRKTENLPPLIMQGWRIPPRYDQRSQSLSWSVRVQVSGVTTRNESDAMTRLAIFGRDGFFRIDIVSDGETLLNTRSDVRLFTDNLRFHEGKDYEAYQPGTDPVMRRGLESVLGVRDLLHAGFLDQEIEQELIVILAVGGLLVTGAGAMAIALFAANRRRNRRRR
jgi:uncharacterized membrane-anchored protein